MMAGLETEAVGVTGKLKYMVGLEVEMVAGMESGVDTEAGMDLESTADWSGAVAGAEVSAGSAIVTTRGDVGADMQLMVAGTATGDGAAVVVWTEVHTIAETVLSAFAVAANVGLRITRTEMEQVG